jgi:hypothetical protein
MTPHIQHSLIELAAAGMAVTVSAGAAAVMSPDDASKFAAFTAMGASLAVLTCICYRFGKDSVASAGGKSVFAVVMGVSLPRLVQFIWPAFASFVTDPLALGFTGFTSGVLGYLLGFALLKAIDGRAENLSDKALDLVERRIGLPVRRKREEDSNEN